VFLSALKVTFSSVALPCEAALPFFSVSFFAPPPTCAAAAAAAAPAGAVAFAKETTQWPRCQKQHSSEITKRQQKSTQTSSQGGVVKNAIRGRHHSEKKEQMIHTRKI
jgi:hypothetical protein